MTERSPVSNSWSELHLEPVLAASTYEAEQWRHVAEWRDGDGLLLAVGFSGTSGFRMVFDGFATFEWRRDDGAVTAYCEEGADRGALHETFFRSVLPFVLHTRGTQVLHASAVLGSRGVLILCARSGTGKSTLAYALSQRPGNTLWADDAVAFDDRTTPVSSLPLPFTLRLRPTSAEHFGRTDQPIVQGPPRHEPAAVSAVVILERTLPGSGTEIDVQRLNDIDAFTGILEHAYCFDFEGIHKRATSEAYLALAARVPVYLVRFAGQLELVPDIVDELARIP